MNGGDAPASGGSQHSQHSASRTSGGSSTTARHGMVGKKEKKMPCTTHSRALCCCHTYTLVASSRHGERSGPRPSCCLTHAATGGCSIPECYN